MLVFGNPLGMSRIKIVLGIVFVSYLFINFFLVFFQATKMECDCDCSKTVPHNKLSHISVINNSRSRLAQSNDTLVKHLSSESINQLKNHTLAVLVPFRDRWDELIEFVPYMHHFLNQQKVNHEIWAINQVDKHRFNRAMLLNVGFVLTRNHCDYMVMHDVDLLPLNNDLKYSYPVEGPLHISSPRLHPLYHYEKYIGGILMMTREHFQKVNGLTNIFWGWGREDDELYLRIKEAELKIHRPIGITTGYKTFKHNHNKHHRPRDMKSYNNQWKMSRQRDKETGLSTLKYQLQSIINITIDNALLRLANVQLNCDYNKTPFCDHPS